MGKWTLSTQPNSIIQKIRFFHFSLVNTQSNRRNYLIKLRGSSSFFIDEAALDWIRARLARGFASPTSALRGLKAKPRKSEDNSEHAIELKFYCDQKFST